MQTKQLFSKFWRGQEDVAETPAQAVSSDGPGSNSYALAAPLPDPLFALLTHDDICHAAGILRPRSAYDIEKIVEMLHSARMCGVPDDIKRSSVLMAIEAAGTSVHDLLVYATQRQQALDTYETRQRKQFAEFEARKAQENSQSEAEMARVTEHYAERIKGNQKLLAAGKEALRDWRKSKQSESQRIAEVLDLCGRKPETEPSTKAMAAAAGAQGIGALRRLRPSLLSEASSARAN